LDDFGSCDFDLDPMTFTYELDPYSREIHVLMCKYELNSHGKTFESYRLSNRNTYIHTYRQTDRQTDRQTESTEIIHHAALRLLTGETF